MSKLKSLSIYLERRSSRTYVGKLYREDNLYCFEYDKKYAYDKKSIPMGPDLPMIKRVHKSKTLFSSFVDRIPSRKNEAYPEYCQKFSISVDEEDEILLLSTIGRRGPSSFLFEGDWIVEYTSLDYSKFRKELGLTLREFASVFDVSISSLQKLEKKMESGREVLKRIEIYDRFPEVALFELKKSGKLIHSSKKEKVEDFLLEKIKFLRKQKVL